MSTTVVKTVDSFAGPKLLKIFQVTEADSGTTMEIDTGLNTVNFASYSPETSDDHGYITISEGTVTITGITQSDTGKLMVIGS